MDFDFTPEQDALRSAVREISRSFVITAAEIGRKGYDLAGHGRAVFLARGRRAAAGEELGRQLHPEYQIPPL